ncbi:MAG: amidase [Pseudonocardiales bacterium]|nr:MAG: amidase [Pseudonocardiales bacterium]
MGQLHDLSALEQADAIGRGEVSPVELADHYLRRIDALSDSVGAFVTVTSEAATDLALDLATVPPEQRPILHGVPIAIKDLNLTTGVRTTLGSATYADFVPPIDDHVVTLLRAAGTVSLGKTNTPEFGLPCYTEPDVAPPARTPWDLDRSAGGSSGGAAAAVAAGLVPWAQGSDGGGSIRIPASVCGVFGLKPSRGRVSAGPVAGDVTGLAITGPITRTVADAAALLDALAIPIPGDPHWAPPLPAGQTFLAAASRPPGRLRIGRYIDPPVPDAEVHPDCRAAWDLASELLDSLGHDVEDVPMPFPPGLIPMFEVVWSVSSTGVPVDPDREGELRPLTRWLRERGRQQSAPAFLAALSGLQYAARAAIRATAPYDAVLTPTLAQPPALVGGLRNDADPAADFEAQKRFTPFTAVYNMTGQPAVSLPLFWNAAGLPIGVMLVGRQAAEATLLSLSAQLEVARPWRDRHPDMW